MATDLGVGVVNKGKYYFISYNTEDAEIVSCYLKNMVSKGLPVWYDNGIEVGDKWSEVIADKIANSEAVIMFLSRKIFNKKESFVHKEWEMAKEFFDKKIYVIILDDINKKEVPSKYVSWWIDVLRMQCLVASKFTVEDCIDKLMSSIGYNVKSNYDFMDEIMRYISFEQTEDKGEECESESINLNFIDETDESDISFEDFDIESGVLKKYLGSDSVVKIPNGVTNIGEHAFWGCSSLTNVVIPISVTNIGECAFCKCSSLENVEIGEGVTSIGDLAFWGCSSLENVEIGEDVTSIGDSAFYECSSLENVVIGEGVTSIGDSAFWGCSSLTNVVIPISVTNIGECAFYECSSLENVEIGEGVTSIGDSAFWGCSSLTNVVIPNSVTNIGEYAFCDCSSLENIEIGEGVTSIGQSAFEKCLSLEKVIISEGVTSIGYGVFWGCSSLKEIMLPESLKNIDSFAFFGCGSLKTIRYSGSKTAWSDIEQDESWFKYSDRTIYFAK